MKANEFVKKFGWGLAYDVSRCKSDEPLYCQVLDEELSLSDQEVLEIKRLVESHELVEEYGGLDKAKAQAERFRLNTCIKMHGFMCRIIADVESCQ